MIVIQFLITLIADLMKFFLNFSETDGVKLEEAVWRPTGTQSSKKKITKETTKVKTKKIQTTKKKVLKKNQSEQSFNETEPAINASENIVQEHEVQPNFSFSSSLQHEQPQPQPHINEMPPISLPLSQSSHPMINCNQNEYIHSLNLIPQNQPTYHHHPGLNISQNWSVDLGHSSHYIQVSKIMSFSFLSCKNL